MVVDDRDEVRGWLDRALCSLGYKTIPLASGAQALEVLVASPSLVDLVLTDVAMPQMSGIQLAHAVRVLRPDMPLIYITGHGWTLDEDDADRVPNARVLPKPLTIAALGAQVYQALHEAD